MKYKKYNGHNSIVALQQFTAQALTLNVTTIFIAYKNLEEPVRVLDINRIIYCQLFFRCHTFHLQHRIHR